MLGVQPAALLVAAAAAPGRGCRPPSGRGRARVTSRAAFSARSAPVVHPARFPDRDPDSRTSLSSRLAVQRASAGTARRRERTFDCPATAPVDDAARTARPCAWFVGASARRPRPARRRRPLDRAGSAGGEPRAAAPALRPSGVDRPAAHGVFCRPELVGTPAVRAVCASGQLTCVGGCGGTGPGHAASRAVDCHVRHPAPNSRSQPGRRRRIRWGLAGPGRGRHAVCRAARLRRCACRLIEAVVVIDSALRRGRGRRATTGRRAGRADRASRRVARGPGAGRPDGAVRAGVRGSRPAAARRASTGRGQSGLSSTQVGLGRPPGRRLAGRRAGRLGVPSGRRSGRTGGATPSSAGRATSCCGSLPTDDVVTGSSTWS